MGTFLGNLQVLGACEAEVAALLPHAVTGRWSERFVTVLDEAYGLGTVNKAARRLSKGLPSATVLSVGLADSDLLELAVWQNGKRLTVRAHFPYDGTPKRGNPQVFCQALGLPPEDGPRLKGVWAKGDAEEQLELTAALLGAPLWCEALHPPEGQAVRDAERVDAWLAQRPDPPKVKNQTKAKLLQELPGLQPGGITSLCFHQLDQEGWYRRAEDILCRPMEDGSLEMVSPGLCVKADGTLPQTPWYVEAGGGRVLGFASEPDCGGPVCSTQVVWDSLGLLACPLPFQLDGNRRNSQSFWSMEDGGIIAWMDELNFMDGRGPQAPCELVRYGPDGAILWRRAADGCYCGFSPEVLWEGLLWVREEGGLFALDMDGREHCRFSFENDGGRYAVLKSQGARGELWVTESVYDPQRRKNDCFLLRLDRQGKLLERASLPAEPVNTLNKLVFLPDCVLLCCYLEGLWILDRAELSVTAEIKDHRSYCGAVKDGADRLWVFVGDSTVEAYDQSLTLLSRHRLKGNVLSHHLDGQGRLCVVTCNWEKHMVRVYRLA